MVALLWRAGPAGPPAAMVLRGALAVAALVAAAGQVPDCGRATGVHDPADFSVCVKSREAPSLVLFHSSRCGTCAAFQPTWAALAGGGSGASCGDLRLGRMDVDASEEGALKVGLPAVFFYPGSGQPPLTIPILDEASQDEDDAFLSLEEISASVRARCKEPPSPPGVPGAVGPASGGSTCAPPPAASFMAFRGAAGGASGGASSGALGDAP